MLQPDPSVSPLSGALCAEHADRPAAIICTRCGSYACELCLRGGFDRRDYCFRCAPVSAPLAEPGTRLVAALIDQFSISLPVFVLAFIGGIVGNAEGGEWRALFFTLMGLMGSLGVLVYQLYLLVTKGQSLGKRTMGIKVVRTDDSPVDLGRLIFLRNVVPGFIGTATCNLFSLADPLFIFTADRRCLHDHIADTKVIQVNEHTG
ncbi:RDD family protein [Archangium violaceum]|uniref:RDD family protein n=1 Tax=Archangium violaceum TaxID=83451 RepID=UPI0019528987|nr:RDD family protein [Archangium violaceum]QRN95573.1 RDD family protein [Archangium violaceum]